MPNGEAILLEMSIKKEAVSRYDLILLLAETWDNLVRLLQKSGPEKDPHKFLAPIITRIYKDPRYNTRLKRITLILGVPDHAKDEYFEKFADQPEAFHASNPSIPVVKRNKFIKASDNVVLSVIRDHMGYGPEYIVHNEISDAFDNPGRDPFF